VEVVAPPRASQREIAKFVERNGAWVDQARARRPVHSPFVAGATIPFRGEPHVVELTGKLRGTIERAEGTIRVPSLAEHLPRRLRQYLIAEARAAIAESLADHAEALGRTFPPVTLRDTTSRWGSCSAKGHLSFSWRLILAPPDVLDYVVAHEAAHLVHMNHGPDFWALCRQLAPHTDTARAWLKAHGAGLHRYG
jgi:predicted metal-dependent hydrolase